MPLSEIAVGEFVAVLTTLIVPVAAPVAAGAKLAVSGRLWPAARVTPPEKPDTLNPVPAAATCEMLTLPVPVFVSVMGCDVELPTSVEPKLRPLVLEESKYVCAGLDEEGAPVPVTLMVEEPTFLRFVLITICPLNVSAASGLNTT